MIEKDFARLAIDTATRLGASYADARLIRLCTETIEIRNGEVFAITNNLEVGIGVRVIVHGAWGFAGNPDLRSDKVEIAAKRAVEIAKASAMLTHKPVILSPVQKIEAVWNSPFVIDPFKVSLEEKLKLLLSADKEMRSVKGITITESSMDLWDEWQLFMSTEGTCIEQRIIQSGAGIAATAVSSDELQVRTFPSSFRGDYRSAGYEFIKELKLVENAAKTAEEAVALLTAKQCPADIKTLILGGSQLALQIHESCGHPVELDRVLGMEANYAGTSFMTIDRLNKLQYGSPIVNIVADGTCPGGLGTFGYDDEGVPAQKNYIIKEGRFVDYLTSRETAPEVGLTSNGTMRAEGWNNLPIIRMTNINLLPGDTDYEEIIETTDDGIIMTNNRSWSIDDKRINFQFGAELGWEIKKGKILGIIKNPTYTGITPEFWNSCNAIANEKYYNIWGTPNCGKGQPPQTARVAHGASYARFSNVKVGVGYAR